MTDAEMIAAAEAKFAALPCAAFAEYVALEAIWGAIPFENIRPGTLASFEVLANRVLNPYGLQVEAELGASAVVLSISLTEVPRE